MTASANIFYVYEHWRLDRNECFYVGKGSGKRAYVLKGRNPHHRGIVNKLERIGSAFEVRIVRSGLSEEEAFQLEKERIVFWKSDGADLSNLTDGGEGISGFRHSAETKVRISKKNKGVPAAFKGRVHSEETKARLSELGKKRGAPKHSPEIIEKIAASHRGSKRSAETCAKIAEKARGRPSGNKGKISPMRGKKLRPETINKMREAKRIWWAKTKEVAQ